MNNDQYISKLKKALAGLDRAERDEVIMEIQSDAAESDKDLFERFGSPSELAENYLEGEALRATVQDKVTSTGKKIFLWMGVGLTALIGATIFSFWQLSGDDFDYSNELAEELNVDDSDWSSMEWDSPVNIEVSQGAAVFYWHKEARIHWNCRGSFYLRKTQKQQKIRHTQCLVFLPMQDTTLAVKQGSIVIVRPQTSLNLSVEQGSLRIAENGEQYRYKLSEESSHIGGLNSQENANITLSIRAIEGSVEAYEYR